MANNLEVVVKVRDLTTQGLAKITQSISRMGTEALRWGTAFAGISGSLSLVQFTKFASQLEDLEGRLAGVFEGDFKAAETQLERIRALAADPIVGTDELVDTFIKGATAIRGFSEETLATLANVSVQFDRDIGSVFSAFASGSERSLRTLGVSLEKAGDIARITSGDMRIEVENTTEAIQRGLLEVWSKRFPDAVDRAGQRFSGALKLFQDAVEDLGAEIGERILPKITEKLNDLTKWVHANEGPIVEFADDTASAFGAIADSLERLASSIARNEGQWRTLELLVGTSAFLLGGWKGKLAGGALAFDAINAGLSEFGEQSRKAIADFAGVKNYWEGATQTDFDFFSSKRPGDKWWPNMESAVPSAAPRIPTLPSIASPSVRSGATGTPTSPTAAADDWVSTLGDIDAALERAIESMDRWANSSVKDFGESFATAFRGARAEVDITNADLQDFAFNTVADVKTAFTTDFAQGLADMMNGVRSFEDSWKGAVTSVLQGLQQIILQMITMAAYQKFVAPVFGGFLSGLGAPAAAQTAGALTVPSSFRASSEPVNVLAPVHIHAGFVDASGAESFFVRNSRTISDIATGAVATAIDRSPAFRARVKR